MGTLAIFLRDHHPHELRIRRSQLSWHKRQRCGRHRKLRNYYLGRCVGCVPRQPGRITRGQSLPQNTPPFIRMFQKVQGHRYCNLGVFFSLAFENTDIIGEDNETAAPRLIWSKRLAGVRWSGAQ